MRPPDLERPGDEPPRTTLDELAERDLAVWSHLHGPSPRRGRLEPLTPAQQAEFAPFAAVLQRARDAGFRAHHLVLDARHGKDEDASELKVFRHRPGGPIEVIVFVSHQWAHAFRVPRGAPLFGPVELEEEPGRLLDLVLAGTWPERGPIVTADQAYTGTCPAHDPGGLRMSLRLTGPADPADEVRWPRVVRVECPRESDLGSPMGGWCCPDGGAHELQAVTEEGTNGD